MKLGCMYFVRYCDHSGSLSTPDVCVASSRSSRQLLFSWRGGDSDVVAISSKAVPSFTQYRIAPVLIQPNARGAFRGHTLTNRTKQQLSNGKQANIHNGHGEPAHMRHKRTYSTDIDILNNYPSPLSAGRCILTARGSEVASANREAGDTS